MLLSLVATLVLWQYVRTGNAISYHLVEPTCNRLTFCEGNKKEGDMQTLETVDTDLEIRMISLENYVKPCIWKVQFSLKSLK